jgi:hypothetical protein
VSCTSSGLTDGSLAGWRTRNGTIVLELSFTERQFGLTDLEAVLASLRLAGISYLAWETQTGRLTGAARAFDRVSATERQLTVTAAGEPVLTAADVAYFDGRYNTAEAVIEAIQARLRPPTPRRLTAVSVGQLRIAIVPDEGDDDVSE